MNKEKLKHSFETGRVYDCPHMKYAAYDSRAIYAIGETPDSAIARARADCRDPDAGFLTAKISDELAAEIQVDGWDGFSQSFDVIDGHIVAS